MAKTPKNHGKPWSSTDVAKLEKLAASNTPTRVIGINLGRTESSIYSKASEENISVKPTNQSPYNSKGS
ncbi:hypothetical protein A6U89_28935 [Agrobacterium sp. B133/95]|nr:hypothetical protein [Rhizobium rhizogenes]NTJ54718.1 hypothetical protein [Rhizobium rhizogenes]OCJ27802.1 hypothetical protein A6U89_28935 [Agrobacterium sp. B133/95]